MAAVQASEAEFKEYGSSTRWLILIGLMLGTLMQVIDTSIVSVSIPQMMGNLGATLDQISWVTTGYIIANVIVLPLTGWLASVMGRKMFLAGSMVVFTLASVACGMSTTLNQLVFFRIIQGAGGAALLSTAQATMMEIFPPQQLGMVQALYGIGVMVGPTVGPTLGGWITDNYSWPWVFFINIPIGIAATIMVWLFLHDSEHKRKPGAGVDFAGIGFLAVGLGTMQMVLEKGNREGWFDSSLIRWLSFLSVFGIASFIIWELRAKHPAVNLRILKNRSFAAGNVFGAVVGFGLYGGIFILPVFLQQVRGYTAQQTGWILFMGAMATAICMPIVGKMVSMFSSRSLVLFGAVGVVVAMYLLTTMTLDTGPQHLFWPLVIRGASLGFLFVPLTLATLSGLHGKDMADATGLFTLSRQIGGSAGIAFLSTFLDHRIELHRTTLVEHVTIYDPATVLRLKQLTAFFLSKGSPLSVARNQALAMLDKTIQGQASIKGFEDVFWISAIIFISALPLVFLFKKGVSIGGPKPPVGE